MKLKHLLILLAFLPFTTSAQNCIKPFNANCWFNQVQYVRISNDGSRIMAWGGTGPSVSSNAATCGSTNAYAKVYRLTDTGMVYFAGQSLSSGGGFSDFTGKNGIYYLNNSGSDTRTLYYRTAGGVQKTVGSITSSTEIYPAVGNTNKMIVRYGINNKAYILNDADTSNPTATLITLPGPAAANGCEDNVIAASFKDNRIYYVSTETGAALSSPYYRQVIKAVDTTGAPVAGWNDVIIQRGAPTSIAIRPTDGRVFVRIRPNGYHYSFHGVAVFDKFGNLSTDMNMTDLSVIGGGASSGNEVERKIYFDEQGNIYANLWIHSVGDDNNHNPLGLVRFDPKGNLDLGFMRNAWNSYAEAQSVGTSSFDISDAGVIIKATNASVGYKATSAYALSPDHINANDEDPNNTYAFLQSAVNSWGTYAVFNNASNSNYGGVQFLFSNGRLVLPGMTSTQISGNCGVSTPVIVPQRDNAAGIIQCSGLSFIAAPVSGTPSTLVVKVPVNVTTAGVFSPVTVSGSGMTMQDAYATFNASTVGINDFYLTLKYDGSALGTFSISVGGAGSCSANLADQTRNNPSIINIWAPENCTYKVIGPDLK